MSNGMNLNNLLGNIGIKSNLAGDVSFLIIFLLVSFVVSFALGRPDLFAKEFLSESLFVIDPPEVHWLTKN